MRSLTVLALVGASALTAAAQSAVPPSPIALNRLGLKTEWVSAVPLSGQNDAIATVQVIDARQIFVQTRGGLLVAYDATTGERQWSFKYDIVDHTPYQVATNDRYVFAINGVRLVGIQRVTGILEFSQNLPLTASAAPIADNDRIYAMMIGNRIAAWEMPAALAMPDAKLNKNAAQHAGIGGKIPPTPNPANVVASRYPSTSRNLNEGPEQFERRTVTLTAVPAGGFGASQKTASLTVSGTMAPPYKAFDADGRYINSAPSMAAVGSLRQPYHLLDPTSRTTQRTPSISAIPPSLGSLLQSTNLRPRGLELRMAWIYGSTAPLAYRPLLTRDRIWAMTNTAHVVALDINDGKTQVDSNLSSQPTSAPSQAMDIGYVPLNDGYLTAVDLNGGTILSPRILWKANVGGYMNQPPMATKTAIYQAGAHAGIARVDVATGDVKWRTDNASDHFVAVNEEHLYARDRHGRFYVFDRNGPVDPGTHRAYPLASADLAGFSVNVANHRTDRIFLASESGLFICLRDAAPKYTEPVMMAPPASVPLTKKPVEKPVEAAPMTPAPMAPATPALAAPAPAPGTPAPETPAPAPGTPAPGTPAPAPGTPAPAPGTPAPVVPEKKD